MNLPVFDLTGRTAIVTGGGRGIGKGICLALAQAGANIVVANRDTATAAETVREVEALGRKSIAVQTDVCQSAQVENLVKKTVEAFGTLDILVNNAGGTTREMRVPPLQVTEEIWDAAIDLNLKSIFLCSQIAAKVMIRQQKGNIINISSWYAYMPSLVSMPYGAAEAGVNNLTQTMAHVLGPIIFASMRLRPARYPPVPAIRKCGNAAASPARWGGSACPKILPGRWSSLLPTRLPTSPARYCLLTAPSRK